MVENMGFFQQREDERFVTHFSRLPFSFFIPNTLVLGPCLATGISFTIPQPKSQQIDSSDLS